MKLNNLIISCTLISVIFGQQILEIPQNEPEKMKNPSDFLADVKPIEKAEKIDIKPNEEKNEKKKEFERPASEIEQFLEGRKVEEEKTENVPKGITSKKIWNYVEKA